MDRRKFLIGSGVAASAALGAGALKYADKAARAADHVAAHDNSLMRANGTLRRDDFDPDAFLTDFNWGDRTTDLGDGRTLREYDFVAIDKEIEIAPGVSFPAWTYNGQVPGPTIRANQGDRIRIRFRNDGSHPHTIHFHGIHTPEMDGIPGVGAGMLETGEETVYEFDAEPYGCHLYHCHAVPLKRHIHKGLYGAFIVDPPGGFDQALTGGPFSGPADHELVMVMNAFDTNFDGENEVYAVNTKAFAYAERPIPVRQNEVVRIFLVNITEFDPINSFHLHANFFDYYDTGRAANRLEMVDTIMQSQAQRGILQLRMPHPGPIMFHAHQSEFAELGWMGFFDVQPGPAGPASNGSEVEGTVRRVRERVSGGPPPDQGAGASGSNGAPAQDAGAGQAAMPSSSGGPTGDELRRQATEAAKQLGEQAREGDLL